MFGQQRKSAKTHKAFRLSSSPLSGKAKRWKTIRHFPHKYIKVTVDKVVLSHLEDHLLCSYGVVAESSINLIISLQQEHIAQATSPTADRVKELSTLVNTSKNAEGTTGSFATSSASNRSENFATLAATSVQPLPSSSAQSANATPSMATLAATAAQPLPPHAAHHAVQFPSTATLAATAAQPLLPHAAHNAFFSGGGLPVSPSASSDLSSDHFIISSTEITFEKRLGGGSFGEVFLGRYCGSKVAVKRLLLDKLDEEHKREFLSEAQVPSLILYSSVCSMLKVLFR